MPLAINPETDEFPVCPAGTYGADSDAMLDRLFLAPSRFKREDEEEPPIVLHAKVRFTALNDEGEEYVQTLNQQWDRGKLAVMRQLGQDPDKMPLDENGFKVIEDDDEQTVLINGDPAVDLPVELKVTRTKRGDRYYNNVSSIFLR